MGVGPLPGWHREAGSQETRRKGDPLGAWLQEKGHTFRVDRATLSVPGAP